jgi:hypothetical protein
MCCTPLVVVLGFQDAWTSSCVFATVVSGLRMQCRAWRAPESSRTALLLAKLGMYVWSAGFHGSAERVRSVMFRDRGTGEVPGVHQIDQLTTISAYSTGVAGF